MLALLDLDGTLVDRDAGFRDWLATFATEHHFDEAECAWPRAWDQQTKERGRFFYRVGGALRPQRRSRRVVGQYRAVIPHLAPAFEGVRPALAALRQRGWRLVLVSNRRMR